MTTMKRCASWAFSAPSPPGTYILAISIRRISSTLTLAPVRRGWLFIAGLWPIVSSNHLRLQPIITTSLGRTHDSLFGGLCSGVMCDQHRYNTTIHPPKPRVEFTPGRFYEFMNALIIFDDPATTASESVFMLEHLKQVI